MVQVAVYDKHEPVFAVGLVEVLRGVGHKVTLLDESEDRDLVDADVLVVGSEENSSDGLVDVPVGPWTCGVLLVCHRVTAEILGSIGESGVSGVVARSSPLAVIVAAVVAVSSGLIVLPPEWASVLPHGNWRNRPKMTELESAILTAVSTGTIDQVASKIGYSRRHTQRVVSTVLHGLGLPDTRSALIASGAWGLVPVPQVEKSPVPAGRAGSRITTSG